MSETTQMAPQAWARIQLPSQGIYYDGKLPEGYVHIRKLTAQEEAVLQSQGMDVIERLSTILRNCCRLPEGFEYTLPGTKVVYRGHDGLTISDRMAIILLQRNLTFGANYSFTYRCRGCGQNTKENVNIMQDFDPVTPDVCRQRAAEDGVDIGDMAEPFVIRLPDRGVDVKCRLLRGVDERNIFRKAQRTRMQSNDASDTSYLARLSAQIVEVDGMPQWGEPMFSFQREQWVRSLTARDSAAIRIGVDQRETGIDTRVYAQCRACGNTNELPLQFDAEFFLPTRL
jgi:hypothetical protein